MKTFLLKNNVPIIKWGLLPDNVFFEGKIIEGYDLAVAPNQPYIIIDVDRHGKVDGFTNLPKNLLSELKATFSYPTKNNGRHYWFWYTGDNVLMNKASNQGIDLRIGANENNGGYVKWHPRDSMDIREQLDKINETSPNMNKWLVSLFGYVNKK